MIIWGYRVRQIRLSAGEFHCPTCDTTRGHKHMRAAKYFTLYFIPLFQLQNLGEYIECQGCRQTFKTEVLTYQPPSATDRLLRAVRTELDAGTPLHILQRKLMMNSGLNAATAIRAVEIATGEGRKACANCGCVYRGTVSVCANCGRGLTSVVTNRMVAANN